MTLVADATHRRQEDHRRCATGFIGATGVTATAGRAHIEAATSCLRTCGCSTYRVSVDKSTLIGESVPPHTQPGDEANPGAVLTTGRAGGVVGLSGADELARPELRIDPAPVGGRFRCSGGPLAWAAGSAVSRRLRRARGVWRVVDRGSASHQSTVDGRTSCNNVRDEQNGPKVSEPPDAMV
jgi:hypothetical protein